ncbi:MAG: hypothetical protein DHS20C11_01310 [Lysobacteraceae bacterium]|nr:MAG: hypothetical protein DHS20C11_01310 [Xanthomonadaceae bacterium]
MSGYRYRTSIGILLLALISACASFDPKPIEPVIDAYMTRALTERDHGVSVNAVPLTAEESAAIFGVKLARKKIQPVWLAIDNQESSDLWLLTLMLDPDYYSTREAAWALGARYKREIEDHFASFDMPIHVPAGQRVEGFVFTTLDEHAKAISVSLVGDDHFRQVDMVFSMPAKRGLDWQSVDFDTLYPSLAELDEVQLKAELEALPCCVLSTDEQRNGDPVNVAFVGSADQLYSVLVQAGWDETHALTAGTAVKTGVKGVFGGEYKHSPISPLLLFGRPQDAGFQMARSNIHQRNHMRVWKSPWSYQETPVWIGQISRDIGVRFTRYSPFLTTHKIDPDIDESRYALTQQMLLSQRVRAFGYVGGSLHATPNEPGFNTTFDPMWSDGQRVVFFLTDNPTALDEIDYIDFD